jgi:hypothetical protein
MNSTKLKYFNFSNTQSYSAVNPISNWTFNLKKSFDDLKREVGREPDYIVNQPNGLVVYLNPTNWIMEHVLRDENIKHCVPSNHIDYLYTTINVFIPSNKVEYVQSISGSVILDLLKNTVSARCAGVGANYATLRTVIDVLNNDYSREEISDMYKKNIKNLSNDREYNKNLIKEYVLNNPVTEIKHHPFAFPEGCN